MSGNLSSVAVVLILEPALESPGELAQTHHQALPPESLNQQVWRGTQVFAFVTSSQVMLMLMLMVKRPDFETCPSVERL